MWEGKIEIKILNLCFVILRIKVYKEKERMTVKTIAMISCGIFERVL